MFKRIAMLSFVFLTLSAIAGGGCCDGKCCCREGKCCCIKKNEDGKKCIVRKKRVGKHLISCPGCGQKMVQIPTDDETEVDTFTIEAIAIPIGPVQNGNDGTPAAAPAAQTHAAPVHAPEKAPAAK